MFSLLVFVVYSFFVCLFVIKYFELKKIVFLYVQYGDSSVCDNGLGESDEDKHFLIKEK